MKRTDFIEKSLRRDRFMVIGTRCEMAGKEKNLIRSTADDVFDLLAEFYEDGFGEETFDFLMDIITEFVSMREYGLALIIQDMLLQKVGFEDEAASLLKLLGENPAAADMYLKQMAARSIIYHDNLIAEPCEVYTCNKCPHRDCPDWGSDEIEPEDAADKPGDAPENFMENFNEIREDLEEDESAAQGFYEENSEDNSFDESSFYADSFDNPDFYMTPEETEDSLAEDIAKAVAGVMDKDGESDE